MLKSVIIDVWTPLGDHHQSLLVRHKIGGYGSLFPWHYYLVSLSGLLFGERCSPL